MLRYMIRRILAAIPTLFLLITIAFFLIRVAPGGPFDTEKDLPPVIQKNLEAKYHLDEPLYQQYIRYLGDIVQGDFGPSFQYKDFSVTELIAKGFPVSLTIGGLALLFALIMGVMLGTIAAVRQNSWVDYLLMSTAMTGISIPNFVVAPLLILFFAVYNDWFPAGGWGEGQWNYLILPVLALSLRYIAYIARLMRSSMIEILRSDYIRTARAKGLSLFQIIFKHALKPALMPVVSYLGPAAAGIITGSVVIEKIFAVPGLGRYFVQGALNRDYTLVMGVIIFIGVLIIVFNLIVDILYALLDPKIRLEHK
ncbi:MAG: oligopeptide ABC transporter permease OppB [Alcanivoracaceae bacterium]|nr:oligopeptide ABC transporter permease OppB [Alcanivoracaceae bacterium]